MSFLRRPPYFAGQASTALTGVPTNVSGCLNSTGYEILEKVLYGADEKTQVKVFKNMTNRAAHIDPRTVFSCRSLFVILRCLALCAPQELREHRDVSISVHRGFRCTLFSKRKKNAPGAQGRVSEPVIRYKTP
jgi:hypothetical protein